MVRTGAIRRLRPFFWFKILNFIIFGGFQKNKYVGGMKILWIFFFFFFWGGGGGSSQIWTSLKGHFYVFYGIFLR